MTPLKLTLTMFLVSGMIACSSSSPKVSFSNTSQSAGEAAGTVNAKITLSEKQDKDVTVPFTISGTADDPEDYTISDSPVTIKAGEISVNVTLTLVEDNSKEGSETVILTMGDPEGADKGDITKDTITIADGGASDQFIASNGDIYIADTYNCVIRKVTKETGEISTVAGNNTCGDSGDGDDATDAQINYATAVVVDAENNLYIADSNNCKIRKVDGSTGIITTIAGTGDCDYSGDEGAATDAELNYPLALYLTSGGDLFIADTYNYRLRVITADDDEIHTIAGTGNYSVDAGGGDGGAATDADINYIGAIGMDSDDNIYFSLLDSYQVRKIDMSDGTLSTVAGTGLSGNSGDGGAATAADIGEIFGITFDGDDNMLISNSDYAVVKQVNASDGEIDTIIGTGTYGYDGDGGPASDAEIDGPAVMAFDSSGNLFLQESENNIVRKISSSNVISTVAGTGVSDYTGDGDEATDATLNHPSAAYWWWD